PYSYVAPESYIQTNVIGTYNVVNACRRHDVRRMVHTSTSETYGTALTVPISEDHPLQPQSPYSASKIGADMMALSFKHSFDVPVAVIRPFNTYGPRQSARAVIPTILSQLHAAARDGGVAEIRLGSTHPAGAGRAGAARPRRRVTSTPSTTPPAGSSPLPSPTGRSGTSSTSGPAGRS